ncbi:VOC family protein [Ekhidna sp.]
MDNSNSVKITGMTLAVFKMQEMVKFYSQVFQIQFEELSMFDSKLYKTSLGDLDILFCPAELAQNTSTQNRHQLNFTINNLEDISKEIATLDGEIMGDVQNDGSSIRVGIKDPDKNTIELIQLLES